MRPIHGPRAYIWTSILRWYFDDSGPMYLLYDVFYTVPLDLYRSMFIYGISLLFHIFIQDVRHIPVRFICRILWMCVEPCLATTFQVHLRSGVGKALVGDYFEEILLQYYDLLWAVEPSYIFYLMLSEMIVYIMSVLLYEHFDLVQYFTLTFLWFWVACGHSILYDSFYFSFVGLSFYISFRFISFYFNLVYFCIMTQSPRTPIVRSVYPHEDSV